MDKYEEIIFKNEEFELKLRLDKDNETIWLSASEIAALFDISRSSVIYHLKNIKNSNVNNVKKLDIKTEKLDISPYNRIILLHDLSTIVEVGKRCKSERLQPFLDMVNSNLFRSNIIQLGEENIIYDNGVLKIAVNISPEEETVWLSQAQIASLFNTTRSNVTKHIQNILEEGELNFSVSENFSHTEIFSSLNIGSESHI